MRAPVTWLQEFFDEPLPELGRLTDLLDGLGLSVETVHYLPGAPEGVLVARVEAVEPIAGSEHLKRVSVSHPAATMQVVCGAPNVAPGMLSALARPGSVLPGLPIEVAPRVVHGVQSDGVLASPKELGLYDHGGGLIVFGADVEPGQPLATMWPEETVIELELTPNRGDAFSLLGVARDVGAKLGWRVKHPAVGLDQGDPGNDDGLTVEVEDEGGSPRFTLRRIDGVRVGPSPVWLQRRLAALGLRPRNNVVDATNLVTFELGQPSHAYDLRALTGGVIQVRRARAGEKLALLNEEVIELDADDLVIATPGEHGEDGEHREHGEPGQPGQPGQLGEHGAPSEAIGLAGVMGGLHDSVVADTSTVALEVALFDPVTVRRGAKRHKLVTDARTRFERGVDPNLQPLASARVAALIAEVAGGVVHPGISATGADIRRQPIALAPARVGFLTGFDVAAADQRRYLEALGCEVTAAQEGSGETSLSVRPPSWRYDLVIEEDLIEEVARLHGYEHIGSTVPEMRFVPPATDPTHRLLRQRLAALGLQETITYVFIGEAELARANAPEAVVRLASPQGQDKAVLRTSLLPGLLAAAEHNRHEPALAFFEVGRVFLTAEHERLGLLSRGPSELGAWRADVRGDFFQFKGLLESLAGLMGAELELRPGSFAQLHPGVAAEVVWQGVPVGFAGRLHPAVEARYELAETFVAELALPLAVGEVHFADFSRQPYAERDLAVIAPEAVTYAELSGLCAAAAGEQLESIAPFDVYRGSQLPAGKRSLALRLRFRDAARALTDEKVDAAMGNVIKAVRDAGYDIRA
ncbi:MAG TPA: phenylalanine--tRNA ligase subunit beta [Trueperaceae bacterium]|nr:phenylalanine--tRNA ligase subunit beta [Trueperaceae bacterium]